MAGCNCGGSGTVTVTVENTVTHQTTTYTESCPCTYGGSK